MAAIVEASSSAAAGFSPLRAAVGSRPSLFGVDLASRGPSFLVDPSVAGSVTFGAPWFAKCRTFRRSEPPLPGTPGSSGSEPAGQQMGLLEQQRAQFVMALGLEPSLDASEAERPGRPFAAVEHRRTDAPTAFDDQPRVHGVTVAARGGDARANRRLGV